MQRLYNFLAKIAMVSASVFFLIFAPVANAIIPNDPKVFEQLPFWSKIQAPEAWDFTTGSKKIVVAVIDTGVDTSSDDLIKNLWTNNGEIADNGRDDDHNGYVDDVHGWDFVENSPEVRPSVFDNSDDKEAVRHGTLVAGLIGAIGNNKISGAGLNWNVSIMALRAIRSDGSGSYETVARAVDYAVANGASVISMSFIGDTANSVLLRSLRSAYEKGVVIVSASGNYDPGKDDTGDLDSHPQYPACYDKQEGSGENWILTVGSADLDDHLSDFSSYGKCLDIVAPGEYIFSTERYAPEYGYPNVFGGPWFGSSFATPMVAGTAALIKSIHPEWGAKEIIPLILKTADNISSQNPNKLNEYGVGRLNVFKAVSAALSTPVKKINSSIYYVKNSADVWKYDLSESKTIKITSLPGLKIEAIRPFTDYGNEKLAVIANRGNDHFFEIMSKDGEFDGQIKLPKMNYSQISVYGEKPAFVLSGISSNKIIFLYVSHAVDKVVQVPGKTLNLAVDPAGKIYSAEIKNKSLVIRNVVPDNKIVIPGFSAVLQGAGTDDGVAYLAVKNNRLSIVSVLPGDRYNIEDIDEGAAGKWSMKTIDTSNGTYYLPFKSSGGKAVIYNKNFIPILTVNLPVFQGTVY